MGEAVSLAAAWAVGLSVGLTACTVSCLPFMGSWVFGRAAGAGAGLRDAGAFLVGRVAGYGVLGAAAGLVGETLLAALERGAGHVWIGLGALLAAAMLLKPRRPAGCGMAAVRLPPLALGAALALVPCAPLATLVAAAAASGGVAQGAGLGLAFGIGAAVTPLLGVLPALGALGRALRTEQPWLGRWMRLGAGLSLVAIAVRELSLGVA